MLWNPTTSTALLMPVFLIGQLICLCAPLRSAIVAETSKSDHSCCSKNAREGERDKTPAEKGTDCDHCRGALAMTAQKAADQSTSLKLLPFSCSSLFQATAITSTVIERSGVAASFVLDRPPPDLPVRHFPLLN